MTGSKKCFKCSRHLPVAMFYANHRMADGFMGKCKECTKADTSSNRQKNIELYRQYDRDRAKNPARIEAAKAITKIWREEDARRTSCHNKVARAVRAGVLVREPCVVCGSENSVAHHESYDRPLDVTWYCQPHHKARHKEMALLNLEP